MPGYKHPCRYCDKLIPPDSNVCPLCGKINPLSLRCPKCKNPVEKGWKSCNHCGLSLEINCPKCGKTTFFGDYCEHCDARLAVICPKCKIEQPPIGEKCIKCNKPLKGGKYAITTIYRQLCRQQYRIRVSVYILLRPLPGRIQNKFHRI